MDGLDAATDLDGAAARAAVLAGPRGADGRHLRAVDLLAGFTLADGELRHEAATQSQWPLASHAPPLSRTCVSLFGLLLF